MKEPLVSILLPEDGKRCTSSPWIASAMSVLDQDYDRFELLIIGNDNPELVETNVRVQSDPRVKLVQADTRFNHGYVAEWNAGLRNMCGDVAIFLEPGMMFAPHRLRVVLDAMYGVERKDIEKGLVLDPEFPESASRCAVHVDLRDQCSLLNRNFTPPMAEWLGRLAHHFPHSIAHVASRGQVQSPHGSSDPEPPDTASAHRRLIQYDGWWKGGGPNANAQGALALHGK